MNDTDDAEIEQELAHVVQDEKFSVPTSNAGQVSQAAHQGILFTLVVNASNPVVRLLGRDHERAIAYITPVDAPVLIANTEENAQNAIAAVAQPASGAAAPQISTTGYVPQGIAYPWANGDMLWAGIIGTTPTRISVQVCRRLDPS